MKGHVEKGCLARGGAGDQYSSANMMVRTRVVEFSDARGSIGIALLHPGPLDRLGAKHGQTAMIFHLEFYGTRLDGRRDGPAKITLGLNSVELAAEKAKSLMQTNTFPFGKASICVVKAHDGSFLREVSANA
jgi:hypothetical protein